MMLNDFVKDMQSKLASFHDSWKAKMAANDPDFPDNLSPGDWDEQFHFYLEGLEKISKVDKISESQINERHTHNGRHG